MYVLGDINDKLRSRGAFLILKTASCLTRRKVCFYISYFRMKTEESSKPARVLFTFIGISAERTVGNLNELTCLHLLQNSLIT